MLSIVLPAFNEELMIHEAASAIRNVLDDASIPWEIVFVDDGSTDKTWAMIEKESNHDLHITGIQFSRNFGKESAIIAGLASASGEAVVVMDCDLQHPPQLIPEMYELWKSGYEIVEGYKETRGEESAFHKKGASLFYKVISKAAGADLNNASDFKLLDRRAVKSILAMPERNMFFRAASSWIGYRSIRIPFEVQPRAAGYSKWSVRSLFKYAFTNIASFTTAPLQMVTVAGFSCLFLSLILAIYSFVQYFRGQAVEGYTTIVIVLLFIGSSVMISLGIIGYYIAKIYEEVKHRPRYVVSRTTSKSENISILPKEDSTTEEGGRS